MEIDGYHRWVFSHFAAMCSVFAARNKVHIPTVEQLDFSIGMSMQHPDREYFEFEGGNVFSWKSENLSEAQKENMYKMVVENIINGDLTPRQALPTLYHNLILAEAIKGNRRSSVVRYLELCKSQG